MGAPACAATPMPRVSGQGRHVPDVKGAQGIPDVRGAQGIPDVRALRCFGGRGAATPRSRLRREDKDIVVRGGPRGRPVGHAEQVRQGQDGHHESLVTVDADECRKKLCGKGGVCEAKMWWFSGLGRSAADPAAGRTREIRGSIGDKEARGAGEGRNEGNTGPGDWARPC